MCACEYGRCGHCGAGQHRRCQHEDHASHESAAAYLTDRQGGVLALVYEAGHRHVWTCACKTDGHDRRPVQQTLF